MCVLRRGHQDVLRMFHQFYNTIEVSSLTKAERILQRIVEGDSDIDLSDDEAPQGVIEAEDEVDSSEEEAWTEEEEDTVKEGRAHRPLWARTNTYASERL